MSTSFERVARRASGNLATRSGVKFNKYGEGVRLFSDIRQVGFSHRCRLRDAW
jgi:hypothetical protein